ncbi:MAG: hypothetical protein ACM3UV_01080 [Nocardioidaceae bacterium]
MKLLARIARRAAGTSAQRPRLVLGEHGMRGRLTAADCDHAEAAPLAASRGHAR